MPFGIKNHVSMPRGKKSHHQFNDNFLIELEGETRILQIKKNKGTNILQIILKRLNFKIRDCTKTKCVI